MLSSLLHAVLGRPRWLDNDLSQFEEFNAPVREAARMRFFRRKDHKKIAGWLTPRERQMLYALARCLPGPITEIGPWVGLSTTAIAQGIRDSRQQKPFTTYDIGLTRKNFRPHGDGIGMFLPDSAEPLGVCSVEAFNKQIAPIIDGPGGQIGMLEYNLKSRSLNQFVNIKVGDFKKQAPIKSGFVFCDAMHDMTEVRQNAKALLGFLDKGSILACHDIGHHPDQISALVSVLPIIHTATVDSLLVAQVN